jgi:hypothetical protein
MNIEERLRHSLRRQEPRMGFAERVTARAIGAAPANTRSLRRLWPAAALAALLALVFSAPVEYRRIRAERAGRQAVIALRITAQKLNLARSKALKHLSSVEAPRGALAPLEEQ